MTRARDVANIDGILTTTGDTFYASAAGTPARLGIGSTSQVLTVAAGVPSWATPGGSGANWSLLNSGGTTLSGSSTVTVSGISSKDKIMILLDGVDCVNTAQDVSLRLNADAGGNYNAIGFRLRWGSTYNTGDLQNLSNLGATEFILATTASNAAGIAGGSILISGANSSGVKQISSMVSGAADYGGTNAQAHWLGGFYSGSAVISSVSVRIGSGNFDGGKIYVYTSA
jgi:hypothetical protein